MGGVKTVGEDAGGNGDVVEYKNAKPVEKARAKPVFCKDAGRALAEHRSLAHLPVRRTASVD